MSKPKHPRPKNSYPAPSRPAYHQTAAQFEDVSPIWLLRALAITLGAIVLCLYLVYAGLFYFGQWQLVLHPTKTITQTPAADHLAFESIRFSPDQSGQPQLTGWFLPADQNSRYQNFTLLYLHTGTGSLTDTLPTLAQLHALGINLFAIDYRGFGLSADHHPTQFRMSEDTESAFTYLTGTRHLLPTQIIPTGDGLGATLAAQLAAHHNAVPAVILRNPPLNLLAAVDHDPRTRLLPMHLMFHQRFEIAPTLADLKTPKLLIAADIAANNLQLANLFRQAASPKISVTLTNPNQPNQTNTAIKRFLDQYIDQYIDQYLNIPPATLTPAVSSSK